MKGSLPPASRAPDNKKNLTHSKTRNGLYSVTRIRGFSEHTDAQSRTGIQGAQPYVSILNFRIAKPQQTGASLDAAAAGEFDRAAAVVAFEQGFDGADVDRTDPPQVATV